ncbi:hypothetical protein E7T06_05010 [Deinococcus sp. Arct2-2]|uniref:hypothetical protein n=1 Tax=Deinococcus sp. Arct2-2 TaxID=2568653 RepID=UPI0010A3F014|nr:hypothetical protein [Deinococcus sp. Arct2-2]THF70922.1 hypothetical protein E7T06_05010 [Deinococcus sp. Arct2-2]
MKTLHVLNAAFLTAALSSSASGNMAPPTALQSIELTPTSVSAVQGERTLLTATVQDAQGQAVPNAASVANGLGGELASGSVQSTVSVGGVTSAPVTAPGDQPAGSFDLTLSADKLPVTPGTSASLTLNLTRSIGFSGAVTVALSGLPAGATSSSVTIPEGLVSGTVTVKAAANAAHSPPTAVTLTATSGTLRAAKTLTVTVRGRAGSLDTTFGAGGTAKIATGSGFDYVYAVAQQSDGKLVVAGEISGAYNDFGIIRLMRDGAPDPSFGTGGQVVIDFAGDRDTARAVALQKDGKIVVAGGATVPGDTERFGLLRLNPDGTLDSTFGTGGKLTTAFPASSADRAGALLILPDNRIVVGGQASRSSSTTGVDFALARYLPGGALDPTFGSGGQVITPVGSSSSSDKIYALALQGDKIIAGGGDAFAVVRYSADGMPDGSFDASAVTTSGIVHSIATDDQGRVIVAGEQATISTVMRLSSNGTPDPAFGMGGKTTLNLNPGLESRATGVALQLDGKLVVGGWVQETNSTNANFALTRLTPAGQPDVSFGQGGTTITATPKGNERANALLLQPDDRIAATRIVLAGFDDGPDFSLTRYWP